MKEDSKIDDNISEISERDTPRNKNEKKPNNFYKKVIMNKKPVQKVLHKSKSVVKEDRNKNKEIINNRYNDVEEEQKNNNKVKENLIPKKGNLNKIFLKNKDYLLKSLNFLRSKNNKLNDNKNIRRSINDDEDNYDDDNRRKRNNFKMRRNNSCIDLRPIKRQKISVTSLKFASNVSKDNDGLILFENGLGINNCFLNAILQVLYHLEDFRYKLLSLKVKKEIKDPIFQVYTIFNTYESLSKLNTIEMLNSALLRKALHSKFGTYPKGKFGDPIETILELLELIHKEYFETNEKGKNSNEFCNYKMCPSHSNFLLYLKEIKFCPSCSAVSVQKYDKDCFMFTILTSELLNLIDEEENDFKKYKYSLFTKAKYLSQKFNQNDKVRLDQCKCRNVTTKKKLFLYKKFSPFLIINMTWDSDFPGIADICKIYGTLSVIDKNNNIFDLDLEKGKKKKEDLYSKYYLSSMILFGQRHYTCFFYNQDIKMWSFVDDGKKRNFGTYQELITYLISRRSFPVGIVYTSTNIFLNEREEKYCLNDEKFEELYKNCLMEEQIDKEDNEILNKGKKEKDIKDVKNERLERELNEEESNNKKAKKKNDDSDSISF